jgi:hypothetical protein
LFKKVSQPAGERLDWSAPVHGRVSLSNVSGEKTLFAAVHHRLYSPVVDFDTVFKESAMSPSNFFARIFGLSAATPGASVSYDYVFDGEESGPLAASLVSAQWLAGLCPPEADPEAYFKEVFAGPVF